MKLTAIIPLMAAFQIKANEIGLPTSTPTVGAAVTVIINILLTLIGLLSVVFIIIGGIKIVVSDGDPGRYKSGRDTVLYAVVGIIVALLAFVVVEYIASNVK